MKPSADRAFGKVAIAIVIGLAVAILAALTPLLWNQYKWRRVDWMRDAANGLTRGEVDRKFGRAVKEHPGFYSNEIDRTEHPDAMTCVYSVLGGEFYVGFERQEDDWVAFASDFLPSGAAF